MTEEGVARRALGQRRLERAQQHLKSARDLLDNADFADSVGRSYYAIFQAARAMLALEGLETRKHSGVASLFNRHFVKTGRVEKQLGVTLRQARQSRERADYSDLAELGATKRRPGLLTRRPSSQRSRSSSMRPSDLLKGKR
jgi:uncharacterized protein (UPF0332 family)